MNIFTQYEMKVVFPRLTFCMGCTSNILHVPFHWQRNFTQSSKMSLGDRLWKTQNLMFCFHSFTSEIIVSLQPNTKFPLGVMALPHEIHVHQHQGFSKVPQIPRFRFQNSGLKKKKRGTRKGAESAGYLVCRFFLQHLHMALYAGEVFFKVNRIQAKKNLDVFLKTNLWSKVFFLTSTVVISSPLLVVL